MGHALGVDVVAGAAGGDPGAVAFNAVQAGVARGKDVILIDTAGRLHTRFNLMEEIKKVHRVAGRALEGAPHAVWLVLDATTGQNALAQARAFKEAVGVTGVILAKLDASARGGMAFSIQRELGLPILFVGVGEGMADLAALRSGCLRERIAGIEAKDQGRGSGRDSAAFRGILQTSGGTMQDVVDRLARGKDPDGSTPGASLT